MLDRPPRWFYEIPENAIELCNDCKHRSKNWDTESIPTCDAFPDGIPEEVLLCDIDHRKPVEGDHGIQFEPDEEHIRKKKEWATQIIQKINEYNQGLKK